MRELHATHPLLPMLELHATPPLLPMLELHATLVVSLQVVLRVEELYGPTTCSAAGHQSSPLHHLPPAGVQHMGTMQAGKDTLAVTAGGDCGR